MKATLVGLEYVKYTRKKDNTLVSGISMHVHKDPPPNKTQTFKGREVITVWISESSAELFNKVRSLPVDTEIDVIYEYDGRNSYVSDVILISDLNNSKSKEVK